MPGLPATAWQAGGRQAAIDAFVGGDLPRAERLASSWLTAHPGDGEIHRLLGMVRITEGMQMEKADKPRSAFLPVYRKALGALLRGEKIEGTRPDVDHAVGYILLAERKYPEAVRRLTRAIRGTPGNFVLYRLRGSARLALGDFAEAEKDLARAQKLDPRDFATRMFHAEVLDLLSRQEDARKTLEDYYALIEKEPPSDRQWRTLYEIYHYSMVLNDLQGALAPLERAVRVEPKKLPSRVDLGILYYQLGRFDDARKQLDDVLAAKDVPPGILADALQYEGLLEQRKGRHEAAKADFERVLAIAPNRAETLKSLGASLRRLGENDKARRVLDRFRDVVGFENEIRTLQSQLALEPMDRDAQLRLIRLLAHLGRIREANRELERFRERHPDDPALSELTARLDGR